MAMLVYSPCKLYEVIGQVQPELAKKMHVRTAVLDWRTKVLETLPE
jgi:hypothetical protein